MHNSDEETISYVLEIWGQEKKLAHTEESKNKPSYHLYKAYQSYREHVGLSGLKLLISGNTASTVGSFFKFCKKGDSTPVKIKHISDLACIIAKYDMAEDKDSVSHQTIKDLQSLRNSISNDKCERKDLIDGFAENILNVILYKEEDKAQHGPNTTGSLHMPIN